MGSGAISWLAPTQRTADPAGRDLRTWSHGAVQWAATSEALFCYCPAPVGWLSLWRDEAWQKAGEPEGMVGPSRVRPSSRKDSVSASPLRGGNVLARYHG